MNTETFTKTDFDQICQQVADYATSETAKQQLLHLEPAKTYREVQALQIETAEARKLLAANLHLPFLSLDVIQNLLTKLDQGYLLTAEQLTQLADFIRGNAQTALLLKKHAGLAPTLSAYAEALTSMTDLEAAVFNVIRNNQVIDEASSLLRKTRKQMRETNSEIEGVMRKTAQQYGSKLQERQPLTKDGHAVLAVKATYKNQVRGQLISSSAKGSTVYLEPQAVVKLNAKLAELTATAEAEEYQILATLNGQVAEHQTELLQNLNVIVVFDVIVARAKYGTQISANTPKLNSHDQLVIHQGRHPLLGAKAVPLNVSLGVDYRGLVITGPNAGGKTIVLKTIGLFVLMTQCGLQIPAAADSNMPILKQVFAEIGDNQSVENALSTFAGHLTNLTTITNQIQPHSLVLLDEIGSGTEPNEGAALAIAVIDYLYQHGALVVVTTHYGEIKKYAQQHPDLTTAAMAFDEATLAPKYQLLMNQVGDSHAFWLAERLKLNQKIVTHAKQFLAGKPINQHLYHDHSKVAMKKQVSLTLSRGDRVEINETGEIGLVSEQDTRNDTTTVYVAQKYQTLPTKRLTLLGKAADLYPADYEIDRLFTEYADYKFQRDLDRGSMKAQKKLDKLARKRR